MTIFVINIRKGRRRLRKVFIYNAARVLIRKNKRLYICLLIIFALILQAQGLSIAAEDSTSNIDTDTSQPLKLSLEDAIKRAIDSSDELASIEISIKKLWRVTDKNKTFDELSGYTENQLELINTYFQLSEKKRIFDNLTYAEEQELELYKYLFGDIPPPYSRQYLYERYINGNLIPYYSSWLQYKNLMNIYDSTRTAIEFSVLNDYFDVLGATESYESAKNSYTTMEKQYSGIILKYEKGLISELDKYLYETELSKLKLQMEKAKRKKDFVELLLKQKCGIDRSRKIELSSQNAGLSDDYMIDEYKYYLDKALKERSEVVDANLKLEVLKKELQYYDKYVNQKYSFDRLEMEQQIRDAEFSVNKSILDVTADIQGAYTEVHSIKSQLEIQRKNALSKKAEYDIAVKKYSLDQISLAELWQAKDSADRAEIDYNKAQRDMYCVLFRMNAACSIGPGFSQITFRPIN